MLAQEFCVENGEFLYHQCQMNTLHVYPLVTAHIHNTKKLQMFVMIHQYKDVFLIVTGSFINNFGNGLLK